MGEIHVKENHPLDSPSQTRHFLMCSSYRGTPPGKKKKKQRDMMKAPDSQLRRKQHFPSELPRTPTSPRSALLALSGQLALQPVHLARSFGNFQHLALRKPTWNPKALGIGGTFRIWGFPQINMEPQSFGDRWILAAVRSMAVISVP